MFIKINLKKKSDSIVDYHFNLVEGLDFILPGEGMVEKEVPKAKSLSDIGQKIIKKTDKPLLNEAQGQFSVQKKLNEARNQQVGVREEIEEDDGKEKPMDPFTIGALNKAWMNFTHKL